MMPINRPVRVVTKDGTVINGRRLNEDTYRVQLIDDRERLHSLLKADLREFTIAKTSPMPSYKDTLTPAEIADLLAYLLSLKGSNDDRKRRLLRDVRASSLVLRAVVPRRRRR